MMTGKHYAGGLLSIWVIVCAVMLALPGDLLAQDNPPEVEPRDVVFSCRQTGGWAGPLGVPFPGARVFQFGVEKSPNVTSVRWEFHDGATSTADSPSFTYTVGGPYAVTLTCFGPPEFEPLRVSGSVTLRDDSGVGIEPTATTTPLPPPTVAPTQIPATPTVPPRESPTPSNTSPPTEPPTPSNTPRPRPTNTPGPSPTPRPSLTPSPTEVRVVCPGIGFDQPDPNSPTTVEFYITEGGENIDFVRWTISDTSQSISNTPPDFRSGPIQFLESGLYTVSAEAVSEIAGSVPDDCGQIVLNVNVEVDDDFELGEGEARLTQTPPGPDAPPTPEIAPTSTPTAPPVTVIEWQPIDIGDAVCPDWITYHTDQTGDWEIFRLGELPPDWNGDANLSQGVDAGDVTPSRSPDARWIAFTSDRDGNAEIYIAAVNNLDNPAMRRLTFNPANDVEPVWSPDGRHIVFTSDRDGNTELYIFDLLTGEITRATDHPADDINPQWSPDSARILFQSNRDEVWQIYEYTLESGDVQRLTDVNANVRYPLISPDGERITVTSDLDGENALYIVEENGGIARLLTLTLDPEYAPNQTWSDDGRLLAYHDRVGAVPVLFVYDTETDTTRQLFEITATSFAPNWICNSYTLVFTSTTFGQPDLFTIDATPADLPNPSLLTVRADAQRLTTTRASDLYPRNLPVTEDKLMLLIAGGLAGTGEVVIR